MRYGVISFAAVILLLTRAASADLVELDITFGSVADAAQTGFAIWSQTELDLQDPFFDLEDHILGNPFVAFDGGSNPTPIAFGSGPDDPFGFPLGDGSSYAPPSSLGLALPNTSYTFAWDLSAGSYTFALLDSLGDGLNCGGFCLTGGFNLSVAGGSVSSGVGAINPDPNAFPPDAVTLISFEVEGVSVPGVSVPEPASLSLLSIGLLGLVAARRRRN